MHGFNGQGSSQTCRGSRVRIVARCSMNVRGFRRNDRGRIPILDGLHDDTGRRDTPRRRVSSPLGLPCELAFTPMPPRTSNVSRIPENLGEIFRVAGRASPIYLAANSFHRRLGR